MISILFWLVHVAKIVKGESRGKWKTKFSTFDYAEPHPIFYKDSEKMENKVFNV